MYFDFGMFLPVLSIIGEIVGWTIAFIAPALIVPWLLVKLLERRNASTAR